MKLSPEGQIYEVILDSKAGKFKFNEFLTKPYMNADDSESTMQSFSCTHKPRMPKDRDVCVFYYPYKNGLTLNTAASSLFASFTESTVSTAVRFGTPATNCRALLLCTCPMKRHWMSLGIKGAFSTISWT